MKWPYQIHSIAWFFHTSALAPFDANVDLKKPPIQMMSKNCAISNKWSSMNIPPGETLTGDKRASPFCFPALTKAGSLQGAMQNGDMKGILGCWVLPQRQRSLQCRAHTSYTEGFIKNCVNCQVYYYMLPLEIPYSQCVCFNEEWVRRWVSECVGMRVCV